MKNNRWILGLMIILFLFGGLFYYFNKTVTINYHCDNDKKITAQFNYNFEKVKIGDIILNHANSADGMRYATNNESFVFWSKGETAFALENDKLTYENCIEEGR